MRIDVVTIFPEYLAPLGLSLAGKARESGLLDVHVHDLRDWTHDRHRTVDDTPYGGGAGMVMKAEPWGEALDDLTGQVSYEFPGKQHLLKDLRQCIIVNYFCPCLLEVRMKTAGCRQYRCGWYRSSAI